MNDNKPTPPSVILSAEARKQVTEALQGLPEHLRAQAKFLDDAGAAISATMHRTWASAVESLEASRIAPEGQAAEKWLEEADKLLDKMCFANSAPTSNIATQLRFHLRKRIAAPKAVPAQADMTDAEIDAIYYKSQGQHLREQDAVRVRSFARATLSAGKERGDALLREAAECMDRARGILTDNNPRPACNWGMLDSTAIRTYLEGGK